MSNEAVPATPAEIVEKRLRELKVILDGEIHYRLERVFPKLAGWGSNGDIKRRGKLIGFVEPTLKRMLFNGEEVLYVAKGVQYSLAENYFMGALWATLLNQTVFVLTNARLLMMRSNSKGKPSEMFWVIYYSEIQEFKANWTGVLNLRLKDNKKLKFTGFTSIDRQSMPTIFQNAMDDYRKHDFTPTASQSQETLCGHCFKVVPKSEYLCEYCGTEYWTPRQLAFRSLVFPSWGDICMKHYGMAFFELLGYLFSWIAAAVNLIGGNPTQGLIIIAMIFLFEHTIDAIVTYIIASKGLNHRRDPDPNRMVADVENDEVEAADEIE